MRRSILVIGIAVGVLTCSAAVAQEEAAPAEATRKAPEPVDPSSPEARAADAAASEAEQPPEAENLRQLLDLLAASRGQARIDNAEREKRFLEAREDQRATLDEAKAQVARAEELSERLENIFQNYETELAESEARLTNRLGSLGELFGVVRQVAGTTRSNFENSLTSAQLPDERDAFLAELGKKKELPSIDALEKLWFELQREMTEQGRVVRFDVPVLTVEGGEESKEVVRIGVFSAISNGEFLLWEPGLQKLRELNRQPPSQYTANLADFESAESGLAQVSIDPGRGSLLSVLIDTRSLPERIPEGGYIGYAIIILGLIAALIAIARIVVLWGIDRKVTAQQETSQASANNPLGRVINVFENNQTADLETLELKLDEAVMRETSRLERFIALVKVVSVVAPLMGLLGTVTGMIRTFQSITLFGAGDPRMMAGGISEALVTTMLGLLVAIPLVLLHTALASNTKKIVNVLDEQSAGLIARQAEARRA
jgi:biopolymer transport protein ExbB